MNTPEPQDRRPFPCLASVLQPCSFPKCNCGEADAAALPELRTTNAAGRPSADQAPVPGDAQAVAPGAVPAAPSEGPTPRTDAVITGGTIGQNMLLEHARQLERELAWCRKLIQDQANALDHGAVSASGGWHHFDAAYSKACESSQPRDWMQAALLAQQVRNAVSTIGALTWDGKGHPPRGFKIKLNGVFGGETERVVRFQPGDRVTTPDGPGKVSEDIATVWVALDREGSLRAYSTDKLSFVSAIGKVSDG